MAVNHWSLPVPARGGAEVALGIYYKTFLIYRTWMRRAPARPVRACFVRSCCSVVVQEHDLRTTPVQCNAKRRLSSHFTLRSSHPALHTSHSHTSSHLKSCELFSPHLSSSHLIPSLLTCHLSTGKFFSTVFISSEHWSTFLISSKFVSTHLSCSACQKALTVREKALAQTRRRLARERKTHFSSSSEYGSRKKYSVNGWWSLYELWRDRLWKVRLIKKRIHVITYAHALCCLVKGIVWHMTCNHRET